MKALTWILPLAMLAGNSHAAIIASGLRDIVIPTTFVGVYLDVDAGTTVAEEAAGWDINPFFGGEGIANSPSFEPVRMTVNVDSAVVNLGFGETVGAASTFAAGYAGSASHIGGSAEQFVSGNEGYIGFKLTTDSNDGPYYGWMRLVLANNGSTGLIRDWAYETSGGTITVGAVPEPATATLVAACAVAFTFRRRRSAGGEGISTL
jgi:hypothetical protein